MREVQFKQAYLSAKLRFGTLPDAEEREKIESIKLVEPNESIFGMGQTRIPGLMIDKDLEQ